jgi:hypothetical protein
MATPHLTALQAKHAGIDARLNEEASRPAPDATLVATLKKQKLIIKQEIAAL